MDTSGAIQTMFPWACGQMELSAPVGQAPPLPPLPHSFQVRLVNVSEGGRDRWETYPTLREAREAAEHTNKFSANWRAEVTSI